MVTLTSSFYSLQCQLLNAPPEKAFFDVTVNDSLTHYERLLVVLKDPNDRWNDTLFDGKLDSTKQLFHLPAPHYQGEIARLEIQGFSGIQPLFQEARLFDPATSQTQIVSFIRVVIPVDTIPRGYSLRMQDTVFSIGDLIPISIRSLDPSSPLPNWIHWDLNADGKADDSQAVDQTTRAWFFKIRFQVPGKFGVKTRLSYPNGNTQNMVSQVVVLLDPPEADAGHDTTVFIGGQIHLNAGGFDHYDPIIKREWSLEGGAFWSVPWIATTYPAPNLPGNYVFVLRVTDSDGISALDTLRVKVLSP